MALPDGFTEAAVGALIAAVGAYPLIRRQVSVAWRETAEGWKARAEELQKRVDEGEKERGAMRERVAALEARPDMTDVAEVLRDHGNLLLAVTRTLQRLEQRMAQHEEAAAERSMALVEALRSALPSGRDGTTQEG